MRRGTLGFFVFIILSSVLSSAIKGGDFYAAGDGSGGTDNPGGAFPPGEYFAYHARYFVGDTTNPRCSTFVPMRLNTSADTNYWYGGILWANQGDWGNADRYDSIKISDPCATYDEWEGASSKSIMMHYSCIPTPDNFQAENPGGPQFLCTGTPLSIVGNACEEDIHVFGTDDLWNVTNRIGPDTGDTVANPLFLPVNIIIDTIYWYLQSGVYGADSFYTFYDTGRFVPESVLESSYDGADTVQTWITSVHTADPRLLTGPDGDFYLFFLAAFSGCWYHGSHYNCIKAGSVYVSKSINGMDWENPVPITHLSACLVSPAPIIESDGSATMWVASAYDIEAAYSPGAIYRFSSEHIRPDTGFWPPAEPCAHDFTGVTASCDGERIWHIGVKATAGGNRTMVFNTTRSSCGGYIGLCTSGDGGLTWNCQTDPLLEIIPGRWDSGVLYAPELIASDNTASGWLIFYSGCDQNNNGWHAAFTPLLVSGSGHIMSGDANSDRNVNVGDVVFLISYIYRSGAPPEVLDACDANCDSDVNVGDAVYLITYIFKGGPEPCLR